LFLLLLLPATVKKWCQ